MKTIAENLATVMVESNPDEKLGVIVTANGALPKDFGLQAFEGLDGLYHGQLSQSKIKELSTHPNVKAVELDGQNTIL